MVERKHLKSAFAYLFEWFGMVVDIFRIIEKFNN